MIRKKVHETSEKYSQEKKAASKLPNEIEKKVKEGGLNQKQKEILKQRDHAHKLIGKAEHLEKYIHKEFVKTGINGFDELFEKGIPKGTSTLICGGPGSGKTIMGLQILYKILVSSWKN